MATTIDHSPIEFKGFALCAGLGGGTMGGMQARASWSGVSGSIRYVGAVDSDPLVCEGYRELTGSPATCLDLFSHDQYVDFHGAEPPETWREATPEDIRAAANGEFPDVVFTSPPCKGFSGLLPNKSAESAKYQALNRLTIRSISLCLEAFEAEPPRIFLLENVPRIKTRGADLLKDIKKLLRSHGYTCHDSDHDCGEIGGLGQRRKRYLLIARHMKRCKPFVYQPPLRPLKAIGDVIGPLPLPDDPGMGPMHRLPRLKWLTWLRLALIPAGGDWRDLQKITPEEYRISWEPRGQTKGAYNVQPWEEPSTAVTGNGTVSGSSPSTVADPRLTMNGDTFNGSPGLYGVNVWSEPGPAVTGSAKVSSSNTPAAIADPRVPEKGGRHHSHYNVTGFEEPGGTVTGATHVANGAACIADPRLKDSENRHNNKFRVSSNDEPAPCVTGARFGSGALAFADPRLPQSKGIFPNRFAVKDWDRSAACVTGDTDVQCGAQSIGDPRVAAENPYHACAYKVHSMEETSGTITSGHSPSSGAICVGDVRLGHTPRPGVYRVIRMDETSGAVVGGQGVGVSNGPQAVADHRLNSESRSGYMRVIKMDETAPTIVGSAKVTGSNGACVVADHRIGTAPREGVFGVMPWEEASQTVVGAMSVHACQAAINDPRLQCSPRGNSKGPMGVQPWDETASTVFGSLDIHAGPAAVQDVRIPSNKDRLEPPPVIIALDGTWHRPLTTLELMALQSVPIMEIMARTGRPVVLPGNSDSKWREWIGNMVPPLASKYIHEQIVLALLQDALGETFTLGCTPIWVTPKQIPESIKPAVHAA